MADKYIYPARFDPTEDGQYLVTFPDLPGCVTSGHTIDEALRYAREVLELYIYGSEKDGDPLPEPSDPGLLEAPRGSFITLIDVWMPSVREEMDNKSVNKTVTLPQWLNELGEERKVNFSQILQAALKNHLGVARS